VRDHANRDAHEEGAHAVAEPSRDAEDELRERARKRVDRVRGVKENVALFLVAMVMLIPFWLIVEWQSAGGFERWSDATGPATGTRGSSGSPSRGSSEVHA
jgi:hypothetical protein